MPEGNLVDLDEAYSQPTKRRPGFAKRPGGDKRFQNGNADENGGADSENEEDWEEEEWVPDVFLFEYGTVVIWGMTEKEEKHFLRSL